MNNALDDRTLREALLNLDMDVILRRCSAGIPRAACRAPFPVAGTVKHPGIAPRRE
jgi:hypothetical protein